MATIGNLARQVIKFQRIYNSLAKAIPSSRIIEASQKLLAQQAALEKMRPSLVETLGRISKLENISPRVSALAEANLSIHKIVKASQSIQDLAKKANKIHDVAKPTSAMNSAMQSAMKYPSKWQKISERTPLIDRLDNLTAMQRTSSMLSTSLAAQEKFMQLETHRLGSAIHAKRSFQESLLPKIDKFTKSYKKLYVEINPQPSKFTKLGSIIAKHAPVELYREANLLKEITIPEDELSQNDDEEITIASEERSLEDWLQQFHPDLVKNIRGAHAAINETNPDRTRHVIISLRELITQILHRLAPDDGIQNWSDAKKFYHNKRPTRHARLSYITREINNGPLAKFVDADVNSALILIDVLQKGTHEITSEWTDRQLQAIVNRVETMLVYLFHLNATNE